MILYFSNDSEQLIVIVYAFYRRLRYQVFFGTHDKFGKPFRIEHSADCGCRDLCFLRITAHVMHREVKAEILIFYLSERSFPDINRPAAVCHCFFEDIRFTQGQSRGSPCFLFIIVEISTQKIFVSQQDFGNLIITILSFGFKNGIPTDSDLVFDVRFLKNPYYEQELRSLTGLDEDVRNYVMQDDTAKEFADRVESLIRFLIPHYVREGKNQLVVSIGCTGGRHRSVTLSEELYRRLGTAGEYGLRIEHRDIDRDPVIKRKE